jgi:hypothetical protein
MPEAGKGHQGVPMPSFPDFMNNFNVFAKIQENMNLHQVRLWNSAKEKLIMQSIIACGVCSWTWTRSKSLHRSVPEYVAGPALMALDLDCRLFPARVEPAPALVHSPFWVTPLSDNIKPKKCNLALRDLT